MKEASSLATLVMGALCFVIFLLAVKPESQIFARAADTRDHCQAGFSGAQGCSLHLFAALSQAVVPRR